ncbi:hypothetical protein [Crocosphaera sp.]|uniref:hypothetical protein n=1 Tax=Crocosphaera sp. TaxID=2729996 RepID=UPI003F22458E|nr:hypothetical protein [Crocosphaera sp.]
MAKVTLKGINNSFPQRGGKSKGDGVKVLQQIDRDIEDGEFKEHNKKSAILGIRPEHITLENSSTENLPKITLPDYDCLSIKKKYICLTVKVNNLYCNKFN